MELLFENKSDVLPKLCGEQLVERMKKKGITFNIKSEEEAAEYLDLNNNYFRTASYRKNYDKHLDGENAGKYINVDFGYLTELSTIDMHLRFLIIKMCLDIEHSLKVKILNDITVDDDEDGYEIVKDFLSLNKWITEDIFRKHNSAYVGDLINKYFVFHETSDTSGKTILESVEICCPVWAFMELITFGELLKFYEFYYSSRNQCYFTGVLNSVKSLRNACAHNNCIIHNLRKGYTRPAPQISSFVASIGTISRSERRTNLSRRPLYEIVSLLFLYDNVVGDPVKTNRYNELNDIVNDRMQRNADYFKDQQIITASYKFLKKIVDFLT